MHFIWHLTLLNNGSSSNWASCGGVCALPLAEAYAVVIPHTEWPMGPLHEMRLWLWDRYLHALPECASEPIEKNWGWHRAPAHSFAAVSLFTSQQSFYVNMSREQGDSRLAENVTKETWCLWSIRYSCVHCRSYTVYTVYAFTYLTFTDYIDCEDHTEAMHKKKWWITKK